MNGNRCGVMFIMLFGVVHSFAQGRRVTSHSVVCAACRVAEGQSEEVLVGADTWHGGIKGKGVQQNTP